jgi:hypothetical protein
LLSGVHSGFSIFGAQNVAKWLVTPGGAVAELPLQNTGTAKHAKFFFAHF